jgi:hypothetical protein
MHKSQIGTTVHTTGRTLSIILITVHRSGKTHRKIGATVSTTIIQKLGFTIIAETVWVMKQSLHTVYKTITITAVTAADIEETMIDYAEKLLAIAKSYKLLAVLLIKCDKKSIIDTIDDLIINAIELKHWVNKNL